MRELKKIVSAVCALLMTAGIMLSGCDGNVPQESEAPSGNETEPTKQENASGEALTGDYDYTNTVRTGEDAAVDQTMVAADRAEQLQALLATVFAYYNKNPYCQYDESHVTMETGYANYCRNVPVWSEAPEFASNDQYYYAVCNSYPMAVYLNAFGYTDTQENGVPYFTRQMNALKAPVLVKKWEFNTAETIDGVIEEVKATLEPGDIIAGFGKTGHALLFLGDVYGDGKDYVTHCWGANMADDGMDRYEEFGAIKIQPADECLYGKVSGQPNWDLHDMKHVSEHISILRYFDAADFPKTMTAAAASRIQYPDMVIDRYLSVSCLSSVVPGEELTLVTEVKNAGKADFENLEIEEALPEGVELLSGELKKTVKIPAGGTEKLELTVKVTAKAGELIRFPAGRVANVPTRDITVQVAASKLSDEEVEALNALAERLASGEENATRELKAVNYIYEKVTGKKLALPNKVSEYLEQCFTEKTVDGVKYLVPKEVNEKNRYLTALQARKMFGGLYRLSAGHMGERMLDVRELYFEPGDVVIRLTKSNQTKAEKTSGIQVYVYLGNGRAVLLSKTTSIEDFGKLTDYMLSSNQFIVLRPSVLLP